MRQGIFGHAVELIATARRIVLVLAGWLTNSMEQAPSWEANIHSPNPEILRLLWKPKVHYLVHKSHPLVRILSQMHPVHIFSTYFANIHSDIIFPFTRMSSRWSLPFRFFDQNFLCIYHLTHPRYMPLPSLPPWFNHLNIWRSRSQ
jgi:hypothetical protein